VFSLFGVMFLRSKRVKGRDYLMLVESYRENGRVRQRVIRSFGRRDRIDVARVRQTLATLPGFAFLKLLERE